MTDYFEFFKTYGSDDCKIKIDLYIENNHCNKFKGFDFSCVKNWFINGNKLKVTYKDGKKIDIPFIN